MKYWKNTRLCWRVRVEFEPRDLWIGVYFNFGLLSNHIYICILPLLPIHIWWWEELK